MFNFFNFFNFYHLITIITSLLSFRYDVIRMSNKWVLLPILFIIVGFRLCDMMDR